jgi:hypothetical protein
MTESDPAIRRAEVDNSERPESDYAHRIRSMNDEDAAFQGPPGLWGFHCARDEAASIATEADARIAELERERDELRAMLIDAAVEVVYDCDRDITGRVCHVCDAASEGDRPVKHERTCLLAAHPAPTPTTAAEPQNLEQE